MHANALYVCVLVCMFEAIICTHYSSCLFSTVICFTIALFLLLLLDSGHHGGEDI